MDAEAAESRFKALFNATADGITVSTVDGRYIGANDAATAILGYTREEFLARTVWDVARTTDAINEEYERLQRQGHWRGEIEVRHKDGRIIPVEANASAMPTPEGPAYVAVFRDITERRELELLQKEFLSTVAHELRNPLTPIIGFASILKRRRMFDEAVVDDIVYHARILERQLDDLLETTRADVGGIRLHNSPVDLVRLVYEIARRTYDLKGALVGVPGFKEVYHEELDRENWGLIKAAQVDTYHGFIFANMDPEAPNLDDYLGDVGRISLDLLAQKGDEMRMIPGVQKYIIPCNWKLSVDNVWDWYHANISHASAFQSGYNFARPGTPNRPAAQAGAPAAPQQPVRRQPFIQNQLVALGEYGHAISGPGYKEGDPTNQFIIDESWRKRPDAEKYLGPVGLKSRGHPNIFPTMWITQNQISLRHPKGPSHTEIWWFTLLSPQQEEEFRQQVAARASHTFGPAGLLEQEDGENWGESTKAARGVISQRYPLHYAMNLGLAKVTDEEGGPPYVETNVNEHAQLWLYRAWADWMAAESWSDLKANHSTVPRDQV